MQDFHHPPHRVPVAWVIAALGVTLILGLIYREATRPEPLILEVLPPPPTATPAPTATPRPSSFTSSAKANPAPSTIPSRYLPDHASKMPCAPLIACSKMAIRPV